MPLECRSGDSLQRQNCRLDIVSGAANMAKSLSVLAIRSVDVMAQRH
jgi:hypothetical protein